MEVNRRAQKKSKQRSCRGRDWRVAILQQKRRKKNTSCQSPPGSLYLFPSLLTPSFSGSNIDPDISPFFLALLSPLFTPQRIPEESNTSLFTLPQTDMSQNVLYASSMTLTARRKGITQTFSHYLQSCTLLNAKKSLPGLRSPIDDIYFTRFMQSHSFY